MDNHISEMRRLMEEGYKEMEQQKKEYSEDYFLGFQAGIKQMMDKIQKHCELGKPVLANGELYFFKDARQNLIDIMDDIDAEFGVSRKRKYVVPIYRGNGEKEIDHMEVIIKASSPDKATAQAVFSFGSNGWIVDKKSENYKVLD